MQVKVVNEFLGVPRGTVGEIVEFNNFHGKCDKAVASSVLIKFPCKTDTVMVQYPGQTLHNGLLYEEHHEDV